MFFWLRPASLAQANASLSLELRFARVSAQEEPLVPRSDQNKVLGTFLSVLSHFLAWSGRWRGAWDVGIGKWGLGVGWDWVLGLGIGDLGTVD